MFHEGYGKGPKLKPDATSNLNDIFGVEFAKQPTPLPAARPQGAKFAVFAEEEEPAAKPPAKPKGGKKFAVFAEEAEPAAKPPAKPKGGKKFAVFAEEAEEPAATASTGAQAVPL